MATSMSTPKPARHPWPAIPPGWARSAAPTRKPCAGPYGYRPNVGALDAVDKLTVKLQLGAYHFVVEADIPGIVRSYGS